MAKAKKKAVKKKAAKKRKAAPKVAVKTKQAAKPAAKKSDVKRKKLINLKVASKDLELLVARAKKFANGNLSAWLRYAGQNHTPVKKIEIL